MPPSRRSARTASSSAAREAVQPYTTRANRQRSPDSSRSSAAIARPTNSKTSLRLTVKAPPSKLRQATSGSQIATSIPPNPYADNASESDATPQPAARTARTTRNPRTVVEPESDEEDEEEEEEEEVEQEEEEMRDEPLADEDSEEDAEAEDDSEEEEGDDDEDEDDNEEDEEMEDELQANHPPPPIIKQERPSGKIKPNVTVTAPPEGPMKSVEAKEMEDDDDDEEEELSELDDSNENDEEDEEEDDSDDEENDISRSATPDLSKLTRRQRGAYEEADSNNLMALSNEAQKKKHLTAEEHAMRRAEMARRRKNLSEKRNEEEKMDTINKLLKKPAPKRRTRAEIIAAQQMESMATPGAEEGDEERPDPLFVRWVNNSEGSRIGVPEEWLDAPVGEIFLRHSGLSSGRMVEEVA